MLNSQQTSLPQEIFDNVIDHFHADIQTLQSCALVALAWLSSARAHLFHNITLEPPKITRGAGASFYFIRSRRSPCQKLFDTIEWSAKGRLGGIMPYIRELHLCEGMLAHEWLAHEPTLPLLLRSLPNLRRFEISRSASVRIAWGQLPVGLKTAIVEHVLCLPALTELRLSGLMLDNVGDLGELLRECRHLRVLEVDHVIFANESVAFLETSVRSEAHRAQLDMLVIGPRTSTALISFLLHPHSNIAVGTVRKLAMSISGNFADFARLLHASLSVEDLELVLMNDVNLQEYWKLPRPNQFDLSQVPHLRNLKVNIDVLQKLDDPLPWLSALFQTGINSLYTSRANAVRSIWIVYSLYLPGPYMDQSVNTTIFDRWSDVDSILCGTEPGMDFEPGRSNKYPHPYENLESVKLEFMLENPIGFGVAPRFLKEIVLESPGLEERKILEINAFETSK